MKRVNFVFLQQEKRIQNKTNVTHPRHVYLSFVQSTVTKEDSRKPALIKNLTNKNIKSLKTKQNF